jgi:hypothetical protein
MVLIPLGSMVLYMEEKRVFVDTDVRAWRDAECLRRLGNAHFFGSALAVFLSIGFVCLHFVFYELSFHPELRNFRAPHGPTTMQWFLSHWIWALLGAFCFAFGMGNLVSGLCLRRRKNRTFSMLVSALNCAFIPLGTALGVVTLIVLMLDSVRQSYAEK